MCIDSQFRSRQVVLAVGLPSADAHERKNPNHQESGWTYMAPVVQTPRQAAFALNWKITAIFVTWDLAGRKELIDPWWATVGQTPLQVALAVCTD